jgi:putative transposase
MALSMDIRHKVIRAFERGESAPSIAARFEIAQSTAYEFKARHAAGRLEPDKPGPRNSTKLTEADHRMLATTVAFKPDITLAVLATKMSVPVALSTICRALKKQGLTLKKSR